MTSSKYEIIIGLSSANNASSPEPTPAPRRTEQSATVQRLLSYSHQDVSIKRETQQIVEHIPVEALRSSLPEPMVIFNNFELPQTNDYYNSIPQCDQYLGDYSCFLNESFLQSNSSSNDQEYNNSYSISPNSYIDSSIDLLEL
uniref:Uncharacterized protein n=1 Tax=Megaselia scalaris TaxID=36166 RepID=T1GWU9_MEGSC